MGSTLEGYPLQFEDIPQKRYNKIVKTRKGGKDSKMSKEVKQEVKASKKYMKTRGEHFKDLVITALIVAILAFIAGMAFQNRQQDAINTAMKSVTPSADAQEAPVKK